MISLLRNRLYQSICRFSYLEEEDADIKIFSGSPFSKSALAEDDEAAIFIRERDNGNIEKAKELGRTLAQRVEALCSDNDAALVAAQKKVLFGYACKKVVEGRCQNSVLARAALGAFLNGVKNASSADFELIQDSVAFTKYMLAEKDEQETVGNVFAGLCGRKDDDGFICEGNNLYSAYCAECISAYNGVSFV